MDEKARNLTQALFGEDRQTQYQAFLEMQAITEKPVSWAYDVWDELVEKLHHKDNHTKALELIESEMDLKYRKKFAKIWKVH